MPPPPTKVVAEGLLLLLFKNPASFGRARFYVISGLIN
tara:strand:- start:1741 stop:1854 length:114 start_codon:yes stop_codon:yes gene_type:complete